MAIPRNSDRRIAIAAAILWPEWPGHAPVMRHLHHTPFAIGKLRHHGRGRVPELKSPPLLKTLRPGKPHQAQAQLTPR